MKKIMALLGLVLTSGLAAANLEPESASSSSGSSRSHSPIMMKMMDKKIQAKRAALQEAERIAQITERFAEQKAELKAMPIAKSSPKQALHIFCPDCFAVLSPADENAHASLNQEAQRNALSRLLEQHECL